MGISNELPTLDIAKAYPQHPPFQSCLTQYVVQAQAAREEQYWAAGYIDC